MNARFIYLIIFLAYIVVIFISINLGEARINIFDFLNLDSTKKMILLDIRLPRILMAILIGALLGSVGLISQGVFNNEVADPYIIGIAQAATLGAVVAFLLNYSDLYFGIFGFVFSMAFCLLLFYFARHSTITLLLIIGIAFSSFLGAFTSFAMYLIGEDSFKIIAWLMGYLGNASYFKIGILAFVLILTLGYFFFKLEELNIMRLGDEEALALGVDVFKLKRALLIISAFGVGFSVAFSGLIGFVGLIIPHIFRILLKNSNHLYLLPLSALGGGLFLLISDSFARSIISPIEIPIGVITAFFGAPLFLYLALFNYKRLR